MKKNFVISAFLIGLFFMKPTFSSAEETVIKIEVPASVEKVDIKYENKSASKMDKSIDSAKAATNKTVKNTKKAAKKTVAATKTAAKKTADGTKNITNKTVESTKELIEDINSTREVSAENLEKQASIKTLKNEQKALKLAYNSRIKDIKAKIKVTEQSTIMTEVQRQNKIYNYEKQIIDLEQQRDSAIKKYDAQIKNLKNKD